MQYFPETALGRGKDDAVVASVSALRGDSELGKEVELGIRGPGCHGQHFRGRVA